MVAGKISILRELWSFLRVRKKWWLAPILILLVALGGLLALAQGSALAPFIYSLFSGNRTAPPVKASNRVGRDFTFSDLYDRRHAEANLIDRFN